jgi:pimeloyl-ACP methyl ester carboxylesterase
MPKEFTIKVPQAKLDALHVRLKGTHFPETPEGAGWSYGTDLGYMKELVAYWQHGYDWRKAEQELNTFDQFTAEVRGTRLHFIHQKSDDPDAPPLLLVHGWPDSFYRFYKVISPLNKGFHVVVPSLPGFGFSEKVAMNSGQTADVLAALMRGELGYKRLMVGSGDIGTPIVQALAHNHKELVSVVHLTDVGYPMGSEDFSTMTPEEQTFAGKCQQWWYTEGAYNLLQSTKPQTLAFALSDSPVGLAAWMVEKFQSWSDGGITKAFTMDEILTNICVYYFTDTIASAIRTYAENTRALYATGKTQPPTKIEVPTAVAGFPADTVPVVKDWAERNANVVRFTRMPKGGHFAALEVPELYAKDLEDSAEALKS